MSFGPNNPVNGYDLIGNNWQEQYFYRQLFSPIVRAFNYAGYRIEQSFKESVHAVRHFIQGELSKYDHYAGTKISTSFQRHRVWKVGSFITVRFGGRLDVTANECCVTVRWGPGGSITGRIPIYGPISLRPSGSAVIRSGYRYCLGDISGEITDAKLSVTAAFGVRAGLPGLKGKLEAFVEGGGYVNGTWDLLNISERSYSAGWYARGVFDISLGYFWNQRFEYKWSSSGDADIF